MPAARKDASMTTPVSNIIAFPLHRAAPTAFAESIISPAVMPPADMPPAVVSPTVVSIADGRSVDQSHEDWLNVSALVRAVIRHARRKGVALTSLPPALRSMLLTECNRGQPACLMLRDWLNGNRPFLPLPGLEEDTL